MTHVYLSEEEDWQLQYFEPESWATVRNIWRIHGTLDCAIGVSTNQHGIEQRRSGAASVALPGSNIDTIIS